MDAITVNNKEIALMVLDRFHKDNRKDSALKLAQYMLHGTSMPPGISDIDREVDRTIQQCGGVPRTGHRYMARFYFSQNTEVAKEIYDEVVRELCGQKTHEGDLRATSVVYNDMYGKRNPTVRRQQKWANRKR